MIAAILLLAIGFAILWRRVSLLERLVTNLQRALPETAASSAGPAATGPLASESAEADPWPAAKTAASAPDLTVSGSVGPEPAAVATPTPQPGLLVAASQDRPLVLRLDRMTDLMVWLRDNWVYAVSAVSLALAGVFFVQYGVEKGLLPPSLRVLAAIALGMALIGGGEWVRRRHGDGEGASSAYIPSTLSSAGIVSMFAGILAARQLYGLIGLEVAFVGLAAVALAAIVLGWFHGAFLTAVGLVGATVTPFIVGGSGPAPAWFYGYFAGLAAVGLAVDAIRRWAWISVLALVLGFGAALLVLQGGGGGAGFVAMMLVLVLLAIAVPTLQLSPAHDGPMVLEAMVQRQGWPTFPTRLAAGAMLAGAVLLVALQVSGPVENALVYLALAGLLLAAALWGRNARALSDLALIPAGMFLIALVRDAVAASPLAQDFALQTIGLRAPETAAPATASWLLGVAVVMSLVAAYRSFRDAEYKALWALAAVLIAPVAGLLLEVFWLPSTVIGPYPWALHATGLAALMVVLAERFARADGTDHRRAAYATLSALSMLAFAVALILSSAALTLALAVLVVVAAALDKQFRLPEMGLFVQAGVVVLGYRLTIDPGLDWGFAAALVQIVLAYGGAIAAMVGALLLLRGLPRLGAQVVLESGIAATSAIFVNLLLTRWLDDRNFGEDLFSHWSLALNALPWLVLMLVQLYRLQLGGRMWLVRVVLAVIGGLIAAFGLGMAATVLNPLFDLGAPVRGPLLLDTVALAYAVPGLLLLVAATRMGHLRRGVIRGFQAVGLVLIVLYLGLEIRRFWRGDAMALPDMEQGELYSYTVALMLVGAGLLYQAIARRSVGLRRLAMAVIGLTVAKVFLIDASGLSGLTRVISFLALGLSLAGLAWLNRWAVGLQGNPPDAAAPGGLAPGNDQPAI